MKNSQFLSSKQLYFQAFWIANFESTISLFPFFVFDSEREGKFLLVARKRQSGANQKYRCVETRERNFFQVGISKKYRSMNDRKMHDSVQ